MPKEDGTRERGRGGKELGSTYTVEDVSGEKEGGGEGNVGTPGGGARRTDIQGDLTREKEIKGRNLFCKGCGVAVSARGGKRIIRAKAQNRYMMF